MERSFFTSASPGKPIRVKKNKWAFSPDPLPSLLDPDWRISAALSEAEREIGRFEGRLTGVSDFATPLRKIFLFQEACAVFSILNTEPSTETYFLAQMLEADDKDSPRDDISLYINAYDCGLSHLGKSLPPSLDLITMLYNNLFIKDVNPESDTAGFREKAGDPVSIFSQESQEYQYIPPPEPQMKAALYSLGKRLRHGTGIPSLIDISLIYYQFMAIQPLMKGNLTVACLLSDLLIATSLETGKIPIPMAPFFKSNPADCSKHFFHVIKTGDWAEWISYFLKGMSQQSIKARKTVSMVMALRDDYRKRLEKERVSVALSQLADDIFLNPLITVNYASKLARVTFRAAQFNVDKLVDLGILIETTGRRRNRVYTAPAIMEIYKS